MHRAALVLAASGLLTASLLGSRDGDAPIRPAAVVPDSTLPDVAAAEVTKTGGLVRVNPIHFATYSAGMRAFIVGHERAHVLLGHERTPDLTPRQVARMELAADCLAAHQLIRRGDAGAVIAAVRYFTADGLDAVDDEHPSGLRRATTIVACQAAEEATALQRLTGGS